MTDMATRERTFRLTREFNAPRELVFAAFSQCEHLKHWWGPTGWSLPVCEMDFRAGGTWFYCMRGPGPGGKEMDSCGKATFQDISAPARIVYTDVFVDSEGNQLDNTPTMRITVTFEDVAGKTRITSETVFGSKEELETVLNMGMEEGITQTWDKLEAYLGDIA